jgi:hypothetical protein
MTNQRVPIAPPCFPGIAAIYSPAAIGRKGHLETIASLVPAGVPAELAAAYRILDSRV